MSVKSTSCLWQTAAIVSLLIRHIKNARVYISRMELRTRWNWWVKSLISSSIPYSKRNCCVKLIMNTWLAKNQFWHKKSNIKRNTLILLKKEFKISPSTTKNPRHITITTKYLTILNSLKKSSTEFATPNYQKKNRSKATFSAIISQEMFSRNGKGISTGTKTSRPKSTEKPLMNWQKFSFLVECFPKIRISSALLWRIQK